MTISELRRFALQRPFVPFTIYLADGRSIDVAHSDMVGSHKIGRTMVVYDKDKMHTVDLLMITDIVCDW